MKIDTFFIPTSENKLHASLYSSSELRFGCSGVLLCAGFNDFNFIFHNQLTYIVLELIKRNYLVMTFDFGGTGNSLGGGCYSSIGKWSEDICAVEKFFQNKYNPDMICIVGFNLGASALYLALQKISIHTNKIVLVDPVISGYSFLKSEKRKNKMKEVMLKLEKINTCKHYQDFMGYPVSNSFIKNINKLDLLKTDIVSNKDISIYYNPASSDYVDQIESFSDKLSRNGFRSTFFRDPDSTFHPLFRQIYTGTYLYNFLIQSI